MLRFAIVAAVGCGPTAQVPPAAPTRPAIAPAAAPASSCDEAVLARLDGEVAQGPADFLPTLVLDAVDRGCRMPQPVHAALRAIRSAGFDVERAAVARVIVEDKALWTRACRGGPLVVARPALIFDPHYGPREHAHDLWLGCDLTPLGFATEGEWAREQHGELAVLMHRVLVEAGVAPTRIRTYVRAMAALDRPPEKTLAERYPVDHTRGRVATPVTLTFKLAGYLGSEAIATAYLANITAAPGAFRACYTAFSPPRDLVLRLLVGDGLALDGDLIRRQVTAPNTIQITPLGVDPELRDCMLAHAGRIAFDVYEARTTIEVEIAPAP